MTSPSDIKVESWLDRSLIWTGGGSVRYLALMVGAQGKGAEPQRFRRRSHNLGFVIDRSQSMTGAALEAAKRFVSLIVNRLDDRDRVSVVAFDRDPLTVIHGIRPDVSAKHRMHTALSKLEPGEGSDLLGGWLEGAERVAECMANEGQLSRLFVVSAGRSPDPANHIREFELHASELAGRGVPTTALAIGLDAQLAPLIALDDRRGDWLVATDSIESLARVATSEYLEVDPQVATDVGVSVTAPRVAIEAVTDSALAEQTRSRRSRPATTDIGNLRTGGQKVLVFRIICPDGKAGEQVHLTVNLTWMDPLTGTPTARAIDAASLGFARGDENTPQPRDRFATTIAASAWKNAILSQVLRLNTARRYAEAEALIARELAYLERYCKSISAAEREFQQLMQALYIVHEPWKRSGNRERAMRNFILGPTM